MKITNKAGGFAAEDADRIVLIRVPAKMSAKDLEGLAIPAELVEQAAAAGASAAAGGLRLRHGAPDPSLHVLAVATDGKVRSVGRKRKVAVLEASVEGAVGGGAGAAASAGAGAGAGSGSSSSSSSGLVGPVELALPGPVPAPPAASLRYRARPIGSKADELAAAPAPPAPGGEEAGAQVEEEDLPVGGARTSKKSKKDKKEKKEKDGSGRR